jgi:hypothetical protein
MVIPSSAAPDADEWKRDYHARLKAGAARRPRPEGEEHEEHERIVLMPDK